MKKNKMMRIASILMVVTLLSTCAISGTFAKYVTKVSGEDAARVAKWGIVLTLEADDIFKTEYVADDETFVGGENNTDKLTVKADAKVVAPGTPTGWEDVEEKEAALTATVKGTPEVAARYILKIDKDWKDVVLPAGTYTDYTNLVKTDDGYAYANTFTITKDYAPVKWDIRVSKGDTSFSLVEVASTKPELAAAMGGSAYGFAASDAANIVKTYKTQLEELILTMVNDASNAQFEVADDGSITLSLDFDPNKVMDFKFELVWTWAFEGELDGTYSDTAVEVSKAEFCDMADTYLGNVAAGTLIADNVETITSDLFDAVSTDISIKATAIAVQID